MPDARVSCAAHGSILSKILASELADASWNQGKWNVVILFFKLATTIELLLPVGRDCYGPSPHSRSEDLCVQATVDVV